MVSAVLDCLLAGHPMYFCFFVPYRKHSFGVKEKLDVFKPPRLCGICRLCSHPVLFSHLFVTSSVIWSLWVKIPAIRAPKFHRHLTSGTHPPSIQDVACNIFRFDRFSMCAFHRLPSPATLRLTDHSYKGLSSGWKKVDGGTVSGSPCCVVRDVRALRPLRGVDVVGLDVLVPHEWHLH